MTANASAPDPSESQPLNSRFLDDHHRERLEDLILRQHAEIDALQCVLNRVRALRDLAAWAAQSENGEDAEGTIKVSDLGHALG